MAFCCLQHLRYGLKVRDHRMSPGRVLKALHRMQICIMHDTRAVVFMVYRAVFVRMAARSVRLLVWIGTVFRS